MILRQLHIINYRNIEDASLRFSDKLNILVGNNGQGKTNVLDAIYLLSFTKSSLTPTDSTCIRHGETMAMVQGVYDEAEITCGLKAGQKKSFRNGKKEYRHLIDHIGQIPLVMISPKDQDLLTDGSEERRRFMDSVICQYSRPYLDDLTQYNALLKQRNTLLKQLGDQENPDLSLLEVYELQMVPLAERIYAARREFVEQFMPIFQQMYSTISGEAERVSFAYISQLNERDLTEAFVRTRPRDLILGWTSQGIHKDDIEMRMNDYPIRQVASQGQQKSYVLAMRLAQALYLGKPILLLDDIFDKLDTLRMERIIGLVNSDQFGQIFITDTDRQHLTELVQNEPSATIFTVENGCIH